MFDCYHFWAGLNKFEDLDLIRPGEIHHAHFQDVPDIPRELLDNATREIPGEGISPLPRILRKLAEKGYTGPLSVELFYPRIQNGDPYEIARQIREKAERVMRAAGRVEFAGRRWFVAESAFCPLASDGETPDILMVIAYYHAIDSADSVARDLATRLVDEIAARGSRAT